VKKGIIDPWRVVAPIRQKPKVEKEKPARIDLADKDLDADLRTQERCVFASPHGSVHVVGTDITSTDAGLVHLVRCLEELRQLPGMQLKLEQAGIEIAFDRTSQPWHGLQTSGDGPYAALYFVDQTAPEGMLRLIKTLNAVSRQSDPAGTHILKRWGVSTTMR
jgi:hypothetical protein